MSGTVRLWAAWLGSARHAQAVQGVAVQGVALLGLALLCSPALAVVVTGPDGSAAQGRRWVAAEPAEGARQPAPGLLAGRVEAVDPAGQWLRLNGQQVPVHPRALRVLGPGGPVAGGLAALRTGQALRFALEPDAAPAAAALPGQPVPALPPRRLILLILEAHP